MIESSYTDVSAMRIHLDELRSRFDEAVRDGESFTMMKEIYLNIKALESSIKELEWNGSAVPPRGKSEPARRNFNKERYRHVKEPPPLL